MQQRRMSVEATKKNEREWSNARFNGYAALNNRQKIDFKMVQAKFWRPKPSVEAAKVLEVCPNSVYSRVLNIEISNEEWCENIRFLNEHALFLKWGGTWLSFSKIRSWCDSIWVEGVELKTLEYNFFLVICPSSHDRNWILDNDSFFMDGKGFNILKWKPNFNPKTKNNNWVPIWLKFPGLPHEYKDIETLRRIGESLGIFRKVEEFIYSVNFSMLSQICIDWNLIHNILDTLEIKIGSGIWIQKVVLEDLMESCSNCKSFTHSKGDCKVGDKGKLKEQNVLAEEIKRLLKSKDWEHQWKALDWDVLHNLKQGSGTELDIIFSTGFRKGLIDICLPLNPIQWD
ncbi:hypothetical protein SUGI_0039610 [Cryptomeria japonica]|nr:hypothetical protein SUGI_0039610 [Cryptomeria japonica]